MTGKWSKTITSHEQLHHSKNQRRKKMLKQNNHDGQMVKNHEQEREMVTYTDTVIETSVVEGAQKRDEIDHHAEQSTDGGDDAEHGADVEQSVLLLPILRRSLITIMSSLGWQQRILQVSLRRRPSRPTRLLPFIHRTRHLLLLLHGRISLFLPLSETNNLNLANPVAASETTMMIKRLWLLRVWTQKDASFGILLGLVGVLHVSG